MTIRGFLIRIDSWCIVGVGGDTESGDPIFPKYGVYFYMHIAYPFAK